MTRGRGRWRFAVSKRRKGGGCGYLAVTVGLLLFGLLLIPLSPPWAVRSRVPVDPLADDLPYCVVVAAIENELKNQGAAINTAALGDRTNEECRARLVDLIGAWEQFLPGHVVSAAGLEFGCSSEVPDDASCYGGLSRVTEAASSSYRRTTSLYLWVRERRP